MISVCMATFNGAFFIKKQLDSILSQLGDEDEIIISDDGSTDGTLNIIKAYNDERIKLFKHQHRINTLYPKSTVASVTYNFENCLKYAKGNMIFLSDQDDIWYPSKVKITLDYLYKSDLVLSNFSIIDENDRVIKEKYLEECPFSKYSVYNILHPPFLGCCMAFNRKVLDASLPIPETVCIHDLWLGLIAQKKGIVSYIDQPLIYHRLWSNNTSNYGKKSQNSLLMRFKYRFYNFWELIFR